MVAKWIPLQHRAVDGLGLLISYVLDRIEDAMFFSFFFSFTNNEHLQLLGTKQYDLHQQVSDRIHFHCIRLQTNMLEKGCCQLSRITVKGHFTKFKQEDA